MKFKYDGLTYPKAPLDILKDKKMGRILRAIMKAEQCPELYLFVEAFDRNMQTQRLYDTFIRPGARYEVNISGALRNPMVRAAEQGDYTSKLWDEHLADVRIEQVNMMAQTYIPRKIVETKPFQEYHKSRKWKNRASLIRQYKLLKETKRVAKILGLEYTDENREALGEAAVALQYNTKLAEKPIKLIMEGSETRQSPASIKKLILKAFQKAPG